LNHPFVRPTSAKILSRFGRGLVSVLIIAAVSSLLFVQAKPKADDGQGVKTQKPMRHEVSVVRDLESGKAAVAGVATIVPGTAETEVRILPPLLLRPERGKFVFKEAKPAKTKGAALPTPAETFLVDPAQYVPDFSTTLKNRSEVLAVVSCTGPRDALAGVKIALILLDKFKNETRDIPLSLTVEKKSSGARIFFVRFQIPDLEPDEYSLIFSAASPEGPLSRIVRDFTIE
jgi:hypothetical protein